MKRELLEEQFKNEIQFYLKSFTRCNSQFDCIITPKKLEELFQKVKESFEVMFYCRIDNIYVYEYIEVFRIRFLLNTPDYVQISDIHVNRNINFKDSKFTIIRNDRHYRT